MDLESQDDNILIIQDGPKSSAEGGRHREGRKRWSEDHVKMETEPEAMHPPPKNAWHHWVLQEVRKDLPLESSESADQPDFISYL